MKPVPLPAQLYRQFDADPSLKVPGEGYRGWHTVEAELAPKHRPRGDARVGLRPAA
jgi:hypothetical protein